MQKVSTTYKALWDKLARREVKAVVGGETYGEDRLVSVDTTSAVFDGTVSVGNCVSATADVVLRSPGTIPRMAKVELYVRLTDGETASEWIPKGIYYIDTREFNKESDTLRLSCYDAMLKTEQSFAVSGDQGAWPRKDIAVVNEICERIGVKLDEQTLAILTKNYDVQYPGLALEDGTPQYDADGAYSMREVLGYIGSMYAGNWIMSDAGELRLLILGDIPEETSLLIEEHGDYILIGGVRIRV